VLSVVHARRDSLLQEKLKMPETPFLQLPLLLKHKHGTQSLPKGPEETNRWEDSGVEISSPQYEHVVYEAA
jgi:hypothetical protein